MSLELTVENGKPAVVIPAAGGECWTYLYDVMPTVAGVWVCLLTKLEDGQQMETYRVLLYPSGAWDCSCLHAYFRRGKANADGGCKHCRTCKELKALLDAMQNLSCVQQTTQVSVR